MEEGVVDSSLPVYEGIHIYSGSLLIVCTGFNQDGPRLNDLRILWKFAGIPEVGLLVATYLKRHSYHLPVSQFQISADEVLPWDRIPQVYDISHLNG